MAQPQIGDTAPAFSIPSDGDGTVSLSDFKGSYLILYFYPRDDTPGCTTEAIDFTAEAAAFEAANTSNAELEAPNSGSARARAGGAGSGNVLGGGIVVVVVVGLVVVVVVVVLVVVVAVVVGGTAVVDDVAMTSVVAIAG